MNNPNRTPPDYLGKSSLIYEILARMPYKSGLLPASPPPDLNSDHILGQWDAAIRFLDFGMSLIGFDEIARQEKAGKQA